MRREVGGRADSCGLEPPLDPDAGTLDEIRREHGDHPADERRRVARRGRSPTPAPRGRSRAIASSSIADSSVNGRPSSRSWVCCAISSDQLTACASRLPPDSGPQALVEVEREREVARPGGVLEHPLADVVRQVQPRLLVALLEPVHDAHGLEVVLEAARLGMALAQQPVQHVLAGVAERRMSEVVAERDRLGQILVQAQRARDAARDLRDLDRVGQTRSEVVALVGDEDLRLVLEPAERARVDDAVAVARVVRPRVRRARRDRAVGTLRVSAARRRRRRGARPRGARSARAYTGRPRSSRFQRDPKLAHSPPFSAARGRPPQDPNRPERSSDRASPTRYRDPATIIVSDVSSARRSSSAAARLGDSSRVVAPARKTPAQVLRRRRAVGRRRNEPDPPDHGREHARHPLDVLVRHGAEHEVRLDAGVGEEQPERRRAVGIVAAVEQHRRVRARWNRSSRPGQRTDATPRTIAPSSTSKPGSISAALTAIAAFAAWCAPASGVASAYSRSGVRRRKPRSVDAGLHAGQARLFPHVVQLGARGGRGLAEGAQGVRHPPVDERGPARAGRRPPSRARSTQTVGPSSSRWSRPIDVTTETHRGRDVGRVEPAAEADLEDRELDRTAREGDERRGGHRLEVGHRNGRRAVGRREHLGEHRVELVGRARRAPRMRILSVTRLEVRRRVEAARDAGLLGDRGERRGRGALPVRAGDQHRGDGALRPAQPRADVVDRREAEPHAAHGQALEASEGRQGLVALALIRETVSRDARSRVLISGVFAYGLRLTAYGPAASRRAGALNRSLRHRASVAFISERSTMKSSMPCSSRNSDLWKPSGKRLADRLLDDARPRESDQRVRLGDVEVARASRRTRSRLPSSGPS